jgi:hypothetical protein
VVTVPGTKRPWVRGDDRGCLPQWPGHSGAEQRPARVSPLRLAAAAAAPASGDGDGALSVGSLSTVMASCKVRSAGPGSESDIFESVLTTRSRRRLKSDAGSRAQLPYGFSQRAATVKHSSE